MNTKQLGVASSVWFALLLAHSLFCHEILAAIWIMDLPVIAAIALSGAALAVIWVVLAFRTCTPLPSVLAAIGCLAATYILIFSPYSQLPGTYFKFYRNLDRYEAIVSQVPASDTTVLDANGRHPEYTVDKGPPVRVAFMWQGMADNWIGVVYDPTGEVMKVNAFRRDYRNWDDPDLQHVKRLFGGDLINAWRIRKNWYFCCFT